jgi:hypothetical protein
VVFEPWEERSGDRAMRKRHFTLAMAAAVFLSVQVTQAAATPFRFVVIGDTRPRFESSDFDIFASLIPKINAEKPVLVINLGDLIYGYGQRSKEKQWAKYLETIRAVQAPYYQIPGNHDFFSKEAREIYQRHFPVLYRSFDWQGAHFILLNDDEDGLWGHMGPAQMAWLSRDLEAARGRSIFVFLHFPVWERGPVYYRNAHQFWKDTLHPLFRAHRVRAVFGGHAHSYGPSRQFDGIPYFITGGGGAELKPWYRDYGGEHHFLSVEVKGDTFEITIVTRTRRLSDGEADVVKNHVFAERNSSHAILDFDRVSSRSVETFTIQLSNPYPDPILGRAVWEYDPTVFSISPARLDLKIGPGRSAAYKFKLRVLAGSFMDAQPPKLHYRVNAGSIAHTFTREVVFKRHGVVPPVRRDSPAKGCLTSWDGIPALAQKADADGNLLFRVQAAYDTNFIYIRARNRIPRVQSQGPPSEATGSDAFIIGLRTKDGGLKQIEFSRDQSRIEAFDLGSGAKIALDPAACFLGRREDDFALFDIALPAAIFSPMTLSPGSRFEFSFGFGRGDEPGHPAEVVSWTPGLSLGTNMHLYGAGNLENQFHFAELVLGGH